MKTTNLLFFILILTGLSFSSCNDNENNDEGNTGNFGPKNVFTGDLPKTIGSSTIKYNSDGLLEEIANSYEKVTFEYPAKTISTNNSKVVTMKVNFLEDPEDSYSIKLEIGDNGFVNKALQTYADNSTNTWEFGYNGDGQLNYMKREEGNNEVTTVTYANGNITGVEMKSDDTDEIYTSSITYTSETHTNGIENKGCIMEFDTTLGIDMDEMSYAYYAGLLGRSTKNLPLKRTETYGETRTYTRIFDWTLNAKGYPTNLRWDDNGYDDNLNFSW
ncbi:MAG: DUF4595 domain-containing protein [Prevotella sp.]|jgi:hypothetical protein|nr:DUF4595 domain-containing protein [Prevotella sp.]